MTQYRAAGSGCRDRADDRPRRTGGEIRQTHCRRFRTLRLQDPAVQLGECWFSDLVDDGLNGGVFCVRIDLYGADRSIVEEVLTYRLHDRGRAVVEGALGELVPSEYVMGSRTARSVEEIRHGLVAGTHSDDVSAV